MLGRDRRQERREERQEGRGGGGELTRYQMRQQMISIGDDYVIENDRGQRVFKLDGKALRVRKTIVFEDIGGRELCKIQERMLRVKDSMEIEDPGGRRMALVQKAMITPVRERWTVNVEGGPDLDVQGNIADHEYTIERDGRRVAEVSKRWFRVRDTYGVEVAPGENDILILATTAVIDTMAHPGRLASQGRARFSPPMNAGTESKEHTATWPTVGALVGSPLSMAVACGDVTSRRPDADRTHLAEERSGFACRTRLVHLTFAISVKSAYSDGIVTICGGCGLRWRRQCG